MYGNVCRHSKSFVGRDFKGWTHADGNVHCLTEGQKKVYLSKQGFQIACCEFFSTSLYIQCVAETCHNFVDDLNEHMPALLKKPKIQIILHLWLEELTTSDTVQEFKAVIFKDSTVVNLGEFIELNIVTPYDQMQYGLLLATFNTSSVTTHCLVQGFTDAWTSSYFQHFFWHHTMSCSGLH
ncbi:hypothetical protein EMCRGX_G032904 [Ephydatia muelleri]